MRSFATLTAVILLGCSDTERLTSLTIGDANYRVPDTHIVSLAREPHQFVRIKPPARTFELVYDSRTTGSTDQFGWPGIFSLNDERAPTIERHSISGIEVVCRRAVNPRGGCGMKVTNQGAEWAVLFPNSQFAKALQIQEDALTTLNAYSANR